MYVSLHAWGLILKPRTQAAWPQARGTSIEDKALYRKDLVRCIGSVAGLQVDLNGVPHTDESQPHVVKLLAWNL
jgi:hypothetical protein